MIGAIAGDMIGCAYERAPLTSKRFSLFHAPCRFTDDSVLSAHTGKRSARSPSSPST